MRDNTFGKDAFNNIYFCKSHGVTVDVMHSWNKAFEWMQYTGRRLGFENVRILTVRDKRTPAQIAGI